MILFTEIVSVTDRLNIVFMGTPDFAVPALCALSKSHKVLAVFCQPDKPSNRGKKLTAPPVKNAALELGLPVYQPSTLKDDEAPELLKSMSPDFIVVSAYGQILTRKVLDIPKYGCVNIHASLLPRWRGAAPIARAIEHGDTETGVCIMQMEQGLDTGGVYASRSVAISDATTSGELTERLAAVGAELLLSTLPQISGGLLPTPQDGESTYADKIVKTETQIDFALSPQKAVRFIHAMSPSPGAWLELNGNRIKVFKAKVADGLDPKRFIVPCGGGFVELLEISPAGKNRMSGESYICGHK